MVTLSDSIMLLYEKNVQISVNIHSIETFNLHEDSMIKEIVYESFFVLKSCFFKHFCMISVGYCSDYFRVLHKLMYKSDMY